ncbi:Uma2 family endonuclease [Nocardioides plantarum]|uniref:Uma2 family endonuclease n=1 Tax=Nocardioides plantarum TaxID=29299 RepID=A0ABV5K4L2_9ACTN|nr:Uma2 family endonuclease [Nocardioides plantarum]
MTTDALLLPVGRPLVVEDLADYPDDGRRYELIDGVLLVSPSPRRLHQRAVAQLYLLLAAACPADHEVLFAPYDVRLADDTVLVPDLIVARDADLTDRWLPTAPLLAIEVLSPSTRAFDLLVKKDRLRRAGCAHYWVVDVDEPSVTAWRLVGHGELADYETVAEVHGEARLVLDRPFPIEVVPQRLVER